MSETKKRGRPARLADARMMMVRLPAEMLARLDSALGEREKRADMIRSAIEREIERRRVL